MKAILSTFLVVALLSGCAGLDGEEPGVDSPNGLPDDQADPSDPSDPIDPIDQRLVGCWTFVQSTDTVHEEDTVELGGDGRFYRIWSISAHAPDLDGGQHEPQVQTEETSGKWSTTGNTIHFITDDGESDQVEVELVEGAIIAEGRTYLGNDC